MSELGLNVLCLSQAFVFGFQRRQFAVCNVERREFFQLVAQQGFAIVLSCNELLQSFDLLHTGLPGVPEPSDLSCQRLGLGKFVEHVALHDAIRQSLVLVLILNINQVFCGVFEIAQGDGNAVDKGPGPTLCADDASDQATVVGGFDEFVCAKLLMQCGTRAQGKLGTDICLLGTGSNTLCFRAIPHQ